MGRVLGTRAALIQCLSGTLATETEAMAERVQPVSHLLARLPDPVLVVLRYLFTFLNQ